MLTTRCITGILGLTLMMAVLVFAGCGMQDGTNPLSTDSADTGVLLKPRKDKSLTTSVTESASTGQATEAVSPDPIVKSRMIKANVGGQLVINADVFMYYLEIPRGALKKNTLITMTVPDPGKSMVILEPHGIEFQKPVTLHMYTTPRKIKLLDTRQDSDPLDIYYYDEITKEWERQGAEVAWDTHNNTIIAEVYLNHFSRYALGGDSSLINKLLYEYVPGYENSYDVGGYYTYYY